MITLNAISRRNMFLFFITVDEFSAESINLFCLLSPKGTAFGTATSGKKDFLSSNEQEYKTVAEKRFKRSVNLPFYNM